MEDLKQITEFGTSPGIVSELMKHGIVKKLKEGDILLQENAFISSIPIILKGSVKVYQTDDDLREMLLYYLKEGETCLMSVFGAMYREMSKVKAVANEASEVLLVPVDKLGYLAKEHPEWINYIFRIYHQRFQELLDVVNAVAFKKMDERLLQFLTRKTDIGRSRVIRITHEELANELGTARVVVSRLLKQMEKEGLIELGRNQITLM
ncbi:MAG: Crp/Fnr family transcriptional regulator [Rhodothermaceae bacterium]|nr:Crp/Fnr family transcriptional regulator [Rhodothermaceae bacterium]